MFITLFTIFKLWKQPRCHTTDEWIMKSSTMEDYSAARNNDMGFEGKWMQLEEIMLSEVSQTASEIHVFPHMGEIDPKISIYMYSYLYI
jgi:hypothetical protein